MMMIPECLIEDIIIKRLLYIFSGELVSYHRKMPITNTGEELLTIPCNRSTSSPPLVFQGLLKT